MKKIFLVLFLMPIFVFSQNVGIGTTTPVAYGNLHVHDQVSIQDASIVLTNSLTGTAMNRGARFRMLNSDLFIANDETAGNLRLSTNFNTRLLIDASGNVGIGTLTPGTKLHVFDQNNTLAGKIETVNGSFAGLEIKAGGTNNNYFRILKNNPAGGNGTIFQTGPDAGGLSINSLSETSPIVMETQSLTRMRIMANGKVGIGNVVPDEQLHVHGKIKLDSAIITSNSAGTPGQVLRSNGPGNPASWGDAGFTRMEDFYFEGNGSPYQTWVVPAGVTKIKVEMWSGGGSSFLDATSQSAGGGGGGYASFFMDVAGGHILNIHVGGYTTSPANYNLADSSVVKNTNNYQYVKISGAFQAYSMSYGGNLVAKNIPVYFIPGEDGEHTVTKLSYDGTNGMQDIIFGRGGNAPFGGAGGAGGKLFRNLSTYAVYSSQEARNGKFPGGGGGGTFSTIKNGANGLVLIYY